MSVSPWNSSARRLLGQSYAKWSFLLQEATSQKTIMHAPSRVSAGHCCPYGKTTAERGLEVEDNECCVWVFSCYVNQDAPFARFPGQTHARQVGRSVQEVSKNMFQPMTLWVGKPITIHITQNPITMRSRFRVWSRQDIFGDRSILKKT